MEDNKTKNNSYRTSDIALAGVLHLFYPIKKINKEDPKRVYFIFEKDKNFELIIEEFWKGKLSINPQEYFNSIKFLKSMIYNQ